MSQKKDSCSRGGFTWSRDISTNLIILYEQYPALYMVKSADYHNKNVRQKALAEISESLNRSHLTSLTANDITKKIHGLRSTYFQELNKVKKSEPSGSSTDDIYSSKWWCFDLLHFLRDHGVVVQQGSSNMPVESQSEEEYSGQGEILFEGPVSETSFTASLLTPSTSQNNLLNDRGIEEPTCKRQRYIKKGNCGSPQLHQLIGSATAALENVSTRNVPQSSNAVFGQMLSLEMDKLRNEEILDCFKEDVMKALFTAKRKQRETC